jgi:hypothetical protein
MGEIRMPDLNLFCESCGARLNPGSRFCSSCGGQIPANENALPPGPVPNPPIPGHTPSPMQTPAPPSPGSYMPPPQRLNANPPISQPYGLGQYEGTAPTPASPSRKLSGGGLFLCGVLILFASEIVRLVTLHSELLDLLGYVIMLAFALPASLLAIRSRKTGKCTAGLILATLAMVFVLTDAWGLITNTLYVMQHPSELITPEYQRSFLLSKISYAIGHLVSTIAFLKMWISRFQKRSPV